MLIKQGADVKEMVQPETQLEYDKVKNQIKLENSDFGYASEDSELYQGGYGMSSRMRENVKEPETTFQLAVKGGKLGLSYLILDHGFDIFPALEDSLRQSKFNLVLTLLSKVQDSRAVVKENSNGENLFHMFARHASALSNDEKTLARIYKQFKFRGVDVAAKDKVGKTPLHYAAIGGALGLVRHILDEKDVDFDAKDGDGYSPAVRAILARNIVTPHQIKIFSLLVLKGKCDHSPYFSDSDSYWRESLTLGREIAESQMSYHVTPFVHYARQCVGVRDPSNYQVFLKKAGAPVKWDQWKESVPLTAFGVSLFQTDSIGRDCLMIFAKENDFNNVRNYIQVY